MKTLRLFVIAILIISPLLLLLLSKPEYGNSDTFKQSSEADLKNYPYQTDLSAEELQSLWREVEHLPDENELESPPENAWKFIGPSGMRYTPSPPVLFTGRVKDIEIENGYSTRVAAASGGLWQTEFLWPVCISDRLTSQRIGSFDTSPNDPNTILVGTGEFFFNGSGNGTGIFKTTSNGNTWIQLPINPTPNIVYRLRYKPNSSSVVHMVTDYGYYRSDNGGLSWNRYLNGNCTDLAINTWNNDIIYTAIWGDGVYRSDDGGQNWQKLTSGLPSAHVGRIALALAPGSPNEVYAAISTDTTYNLLGLYKTNTSGNNWWNVSPADNYLGGQGWYDNVIAVSPANKNIILAGGVRMVRSSDGGDTWTVISDPNLHVDHHAITWNSNGTQVFSGNDGGVSVSNDAGLTWSTASNHYAITQYASVDVGLFGHKVIFGGSQDNGISGTTDGGLHWNMTMGGDSYSTCVDPGNSYYVYGIVGIYEGDMPFIHHRSSDRGQTWEQITNGIDPYGDWNCKIRTGKYWNSSVYASEGPFLYKSNNKGDSWSKIRETPFPAYIWNFTISNEPIVRAIYVALKPNTSNSALWVWDDGSWYLRQNGFPPQGNVTRVMAVETDIVRSSYAYALMNGTDAASDGKKIFRTTNRGVTWTNITGDLPNIPLGDLVADPNDWNRLYLGTYMGCYMTTNGGTNWIRWNNGMPRANIITEMSYIDSTSDNGKFFVVAASYGRGIWIREASGYDPGSAEEEFIAKKYELRQNYPNPFNPSTTIEFTQPRPGHCRLTVFDAAGGIVSVLVDEYRAPGTYTEVFDAAKLASGVYFYTLTAGRFTETKKMLLIR